MEAPARRLRVRYIDPCRHCTDTFDQLFKRRGHEARIAHDGVETLEIGSEFRPDIVVLAVNRLGQDAYQLARLIRDHAWGEGVALIGITGSGREIDERLRGAGFDHCLARPVDVRALTALLDQTRATSE
jgi:DNA-binding response OmpR family regulator